MSEKTDVFWVLFFFLVEIPMREFSQNCKNCKKKWKYYNKVLFINKLLERKKLKYELWAIESTSRFLSADKPTKTQNKASWMQLYLLIENLTECSPCV